MGNARFSKRILVIAPTPFFADRGCHVRILGEVKALQALGHEIRVCTYHHGRDVDGIAIVRTPRIPWYSKLAAGPSIHKFYVDLLLLWKVLRTCATFRPDVIHAHLHEGMIIGKVASVVHRVPLIADLQGSLTEELLDHHFIPRWKWVIGAVRWIEKMINAMPRHLIASSDQTAEHVQVHSGISGCSITSVRDGVDLDLFFPRPPDPGLRESLGITANDRVVVFVGVLTPYQGIDLLLEAAQSVRNAIANAKFLVVGFPEQSYCEQAQAMGLAGATVFTGKVAYAETPRYIALGHVAVSAKISTTEANLKLFSYMAMGLPSVVFDSSVNREILGDLGVYARYGDAASLASAIIGLLKDEQRAAALGQASFEKAHRCYSWQAIGERLLDLYEQYCAAVSQKESGRLV